jgi:hypothetical protein
MTIALLRGLISISIYFLVLGAVLIYCSNSVARANLALFKNRRKLDGWGHFDLYSAWLFLALSVTAGLSTWYYIGNFFRESFLSEGLGNWQLWVERSDLFVQAYRLVSQSTLHWFWSSQLLMAACSFVGFVLMSGRKDAWAFVLLGFLGAISVALALFLSDLIASRTLSRCVGSHEPTDHPALPDSLLHPLVSWPIIAGLMSIMANSWIHPTSSLYMPNLIFLHVILLVPVLAFKSVAQTSEERWRPFWFVIATSVAAYLIYQCSLVGWMARSQGLDQTLEALFATISANSCQSSITLDLFFVTLAVMIVLMRILIMRYSKRIQQDAALLFLMTMLLVSIPLLSVSFAFPLLLALGSGSHADALWSLSPTQGRRLCSEPASQ